MKRHTIVETCRIVSYALRLISVKVDYRLDVSDGDTHPTVVRGHAKTLDWDNIDMNHERRTGRQGQ